MTRRGSSDQAVLRELSRTGQATVAELADRLDINAATVRRSLHRLATDARVVRTYGGARLVAAQPRLAGTMDAQSPFKCAIAVAAAALLRDGDAVALSSGSTVLELAYQLRHRRLTVITNAIDVVNTLLGSSGIELVVLGGVMLPDLRSLRGHLTESGMRELRADAVFMGASAIDLDRGFMTDHVLEIGVDRGLARMGREVIVLADASKFENVAPGFMLGLDQVGTLVTDSRAPATALDRLRAGGIRVVAATPSEGTESGLRMDPVAAATDSHMGSRGDATPSHDMEPVDAGRASGRPGMPLGDAMNADQPGS